MGACLTGDEHGVELEALGGVQRQQAHPGGIRRRLVAAQQRRLLHKLRRARQPRGRHVLQGGRGTASAAGLETSLLPLHRSHYWSAASCCSACRLHTQATNSPQSDLQHSQLQADVCRTTKPDVPLRT